MTELNFYASFCNGIILRRHEKSEGKIGLLRDTEHSVLPFFLLLLFRHQVYLFWRITSFLGVSRSIKRKIHMKTVTETKCKRTSEQIYLLFITVSSGFSENQFYTDFGTKS